MRRIMPLFALSLLAGCGANPKPVVTATRPVAAEPREHGDLIGLDATALGARFGQPRLQVREGDGIKLQFAGSSCLLDAYLYPAPGGGGAPRVTHVDTRNRDGRSVDQAGCVAMIEAR